MGGYAPVTRRLTQVKGVWTAGESLLENDLLDHHLLPVYHVYQVHAGDPVLQLGEEEPAGLAVLSVSDGYLEGCRAANVEEVVGVS